MKIIVCLETMPDPDCPSVLSGNMEEVDACNIRLDAYSLSALEFGLSLKDRFGVALHSCLLDSFALTAAHEEIQAAGSDSVDWLQVPFTLDPFRRAEHFSDALTPEQDDIIIAGFHCETCCTNSIPMLIALNKSVPYYSEVDDMVIQDDRITLTGYKLQEETDIERKCAVISVRTKNKLRYPSFRERIACREQRIQARRQAKMDDVADSGVVSSAGEFFTPSLLDSESGDRSETLVSIMENRGMFQL